MRKFQPKTPYIKPKKVDINTKYRMLSRTLPPDNILFALDASRAYATGWYNGFEGIMPTTNAYRVNWNWWRGHGRERTDHGYIIAYMLMVSE